MTLILIVILVALVFEFINGFHDTANSIATVIGTKVLSPRQAIVLAAITNLFGALAGTAVAATVGMAARMMLPARKPPNDSMIRVANLNALTFPAPNIDPKVLFTTSMPTPHNCPAS